MWEDAWARPTTSLLRRAHDAAMPGPLCDATDLHQAFTALATKLQRRKIVGHVHVFGGAAMLLAYNPDRESTRDIDAQFAPLPR